MIETNKTTQDKNIDLNECSEFNDFFKRAELVIKSAEEYRLKNLKNQRENPKTSK